MATSLPTATSQNHQNHRRWVLEHYLLDPLGRQALAKHARHIRAITCRDPATLPLLTNAGCKPLIEINYIAKWHPLGWGLFRLGWPIVSNPGLRAVSIEDIAIETAQDLEQLMLFVKFLDNHLSINCLYLDTRIRNLMHHCLRFF